MRFGSLSRTRERLYSASQSCLCMPLTWGKSLVVILQQFASSLEFSQLLSRQDTVDIG
uniref:Uncharacterized protein n=1 Tax=Anguilla anguilla TaxID=7936 RepID=A0A0E9QZE7_ANGAN